MAEDDKIITKIANAENISQKKYPNETKNQKEKNGNN